MFKLAIGITTIFLKMTWVPYFSVCKSTIGPHIAFTLKFAKLNALMRKVATYSTSANATLPENTGYIWIYRGVSHNFFNWIVVFAIKSHFLQGKSTDWLVFCWGLLLLFWSMPHTCSLRMCCLNRPAVLNLEPQVSHRLLWPVICPLRLATSFAL